MDKMNKLIEVIAKSGNEEVQKAFLEWQDEGIKAKEKFIEKLDRMLKESEGKKADTSQDRALNLAGVSQQRELLKAFYVYCSGFYRNAKHYADTRIDNFIKSLL